MGYPPPPSNASLALKYEGKIGCNFIVPNFASSKLAPPTSSPGGAPPPPPPHTCVRLCAASLCRTTSASSSVIVAASARFFSSSSLFLSSSCALRDLIVSASKRRLDSACWSPLALLSSAACGRRDAGRC